MKTADGIKADVTESSSESDSSDDASAYESSEEEGEVAEPSPLPGSRPQSPLEATRYDAIKALWRPRNLPVTPSDIREGLKSYWDLVRTIRDRWKSDAAAVKEAEEKKRNSELPLLQDRVKSQRDMIEVALKAALEYGHKHITELYVYFSPYLLPLVRRQTLLCSQLCFRGPEGWNRGPGYKGQSRSAAELVASWPQCNAMLQKAVTVRRASMLDHLSSAVRASSRQWSIGSTVHILAGGGECLQSDDIVTKVELGVQGGGAVTSPPGSISPSQPQIGIAFIYVSPVIEVDRLS